MTLDLDLNASQQKEMGKIIAEQSAKKEARMKEMKANRDSNAKPTSDEMFARKNKMLDEQIVMKNKMKSILSPEQFEKWDAMKEKHHQRNGHRGHRGGERKAELKK